MPKRPPLSNLGPMSEPWARYIEEQVIANATGIERMGGDAQNDGRISNSIMDTQAQQLLELHQRQTFYLNPANMATAAFTQSSSVQTVSTTVQLQRPLDASRQGWVVVNCVPAVSPPRTSALFVTLEMDGRVFYRSSIGLPIVTSVPAGWDGFTFSGQTGFVASPTRGGLLTITLQAEPEAFGDTGTRTAYLNNIQISAAYGQKT